MMLSSWRNKLKLPGATAGRAGQMQPGRSLLLAAALFLAGLIVGVYLFFPTAVLKQKIIAEIEMQSAAKVRIESLALYPLLTLAAGPVAVEIPGLANAVQIETLKISPQWLSLFSADPGVNLNASLMNGDVNGGYRINGALDIEASGLRFALPFVSPLQFNLAGTLERANLETSTLLEPSSKTALTLKLTEVRVVDLALFSANSGGVNLGEIVMQVTGQGRNMDVVSLTVTGGDFVVNGKGSVLVGRTAAGSRMNLDLSVRAGSQASPELVSLLELAGPQQADGSRKLQLSGTLANPQIR